MSFLRTLAILAFLFIGGYFVVTVMNDGNSGDAWIAAAFFALFTVRLASFRRR